MPCVAMCCSVMQCVAVCCSMFLVYLHCLLVFAQCVVTVSVCVLQSVAACCSMLQHAAAWQCVTGVASCCIVLQRVVVIQILSTYTADPLCVSIFHTHTYTVLAPFVSSYSSVEDRTKHTHVHLKQLCVSYTKSCCNLAETGAQTYERVTSPRRISPLAQFPSIELPCSLPAFQK